jgi:hypothetical protein
VASSWNPFWEKRLPFLGRRTEYRYNGVSELVGVDYPEPDAFMHHYGSTSCSYPNLELFNRVTSSVWTKDLAIDKDAYRLYHVRHRVLNSDLRRWISRIRSA